MRESRPYGSERGAFSNGRPYRDRTDGHRGRGGPGDSAQNSRHRGPTGRRAPFVLSEALEGGDSEMTETTLATVGSDDLELADFLEEAGVRSQSISSTCWRAHTASPLLSPSTAPSTPALIHLAEGDCARIAVADGGNEVN